MNTKHLMVDLETLSSRPYAAIIQIGAVCFDADGVIEGTEFLENISFDDAIKHGHVSGSTLTWWFGQSKEAQLSTIVDSINLEDALKNFAQFVQSQNPKYAWSHATFDHPIINQAFDRMSAGKWVSFKNQYDLRTLEYIAGDIDWEERSGTHHNALDDAKYQAIHAAKMLKKIGKY